MKRPDVRPFQIRAFHLYHRLRSIGDDTETSGKRLCQGYAREKHDHETSRYKLETNSENSIVWITHKLLPIAAAAKNPWPWAKRPSALIAICVRHHNRSGL